MKRLSNKYEENTAYFDRVLRVNENYDILKKVLRIGEDELTLYYVDGFIKDAFMGKLMIYLLSLKGTMSSPEEFNEKLPYV